jgi:hypothetical protein
VGKATAFEVVDELGADGKATGKRLVIEERQLLPEAPRAPVRAESAPRAHTFFDVPGFADYLQEYGTDNLVVFADPVAGQIDAVLDESALKGMERVIFRPLVHPFWTPWAEIMGKALPVCAFVEFLRNNRRAVAAPDARELILSLSQITATSKVTLHRGSATKALNGMLVETEIQGERDKQAVELPDGLSLLVPLYVGTDETRVEVDIILRAHDDDVLVALSTGDLLAARVRIFAELIEGLRSRLEGKGTFTLGRPDWQRWTYLNEQAVKA